MENPLKLRRLNKGWTQDELAREAGVTHDNIIRNEQGLFNNPSPAVLTAIASISGDNPARIDLEYRNWVARQRRLEPTRNLVRRQISFPEASKLKEHPFLLWRTAILPGSRIEFCKRLCLHPATVLKYEKALQRTMPSQIFDALCDTGMDVSHIRKLATLGSEYFVHARRRNAAVKPPGMGDN